LSLTNVYTQGVTTQFTAFSHGNRRVIGQGFDTNYDLKYIVTVPNQPGIYLMTDPDAATLPTPIDTAYTFLRTKTYTRSPTTVGGIATAALVQDTQGNGYFLPDILEPLNVINLNAHIHPNYTLRIYGNSLTLSNGEEVWEYDPFAV